MRRLASDPEIDDAAVGFHAQQAIENAVPMRYEDLLDVEPLDRDAVLALVAEVGDWATRFVREK
jgi:hypothetical protein